jgi:hypothetical protein
MAGSSLFSKESFSYLPFGFASGQAFSNKGGICNFPLWKRGIKGDSLRFSLWYKI